MTLLQALSEYLTSVDMKALCVMAIVGVAMIVALAEALWPALPQARQQARRLTANFGFSLISIVMALSLPISAVLVAEYCATQGFGILNALTAPVWLQIAITVAVASLNGYAAHYAAHKIPACWRFHVIHHSDREMDFSTSMRHHPGDLLCMMALQLPVVALLGAHAGALIFVSSFEVFMHILVHANVRLPETLNRRLGYVLLTPPMHAVHHSTRQAETDSNFGTVFSGWDRLFGTFRAGFGRPAEDVRLGLDEVSAERSNDLIAMLALPFVHSGDETNRAPAAIDPLPKSPAALPQQ